MAESSSSTVQDAVVTVTLSLDFSLKRPVLLNSQKLTISVLKAIAQALNLPSTGTKEETVLMIEGKLSEDGQKPQNVQVGIVAREGEQGILDMELIGEDGPFLSMGLQRAASRDALDDAIESGLSAPEGEGSQDGDSPSTELQQVREENDIFKQRIYDLETQLCQVTKRREFEEAISDKDAEVEHLRQQLVALQGETMSSTCTTGPVDSSLAGVTPSVARHGHERPTYKHKGKAPPVDLFSGEDLMTGCLHSREQPPGMTGLKETCCCS